LQIDSLSEFVCMQKWLGFSLTIFCWTVAAVPAHAGAIGKTTEVARKASADASGARRELELGSDVAARETIVTDKVGKAAFRFLDNTQLSVGPNSSIRLDDFVFGQPSDPSSFVIRATRGVFRFATGRGDHEGYRIQTPVSTLGVRGTQFDVSIEGKQVRVSVLEGEVVLCPIGGRPNFVDCAEAVAGQSILSSRTRANVVPTSSLPQLRADLLPLSSVTNLASGVLPMAAGALGAASSATGGVTSAATNAATATTAAATGALGGLGSGASSAAAGIGNTAGSLGGAAGGLGTTVGGLGSATGGLGGALGGAVGGLGNATGAVGGIGGALGGVRIGR
jgi:hypothetical protein